jgi:TRAP-type C4-dicarboxylate transport system permease small subunit
LIGWNRAAACSRPGIPDIRSIVERRSAWEVRGMGMSGYSTALEQVRRLLSAAGGLAIVATMALIVTDVVSRQFDLVIPAVYEVVVNYLMPAITFLPLMQVERDEQMISVEIVGMFGGDRVQSALKFFATLASLLVYAALAYATALEALHQMSVRSYLVVLDIKLPIWVAHFVLPISFAAAVLVVIDRALHGSRGAAAVPLPHGE